MQPRTDDKPFAQEAVVDANLCTSCGICAGACPTATPFRRASALTPGIDVPDSSIRELRDRTLSAADRLSGDAKVIVYGCQAGVNLDALQGPGIATLCAPCTAALPPSFLDFVISRHHADGVFLTGCREGDCFNRQGIMWVQQRIAGQRDPYLRARVPRERIARFWAGVARPRQLADELDAFRNRLTELGPFKKSVPKLHDHRK